MEFLHICPCFSLLQARRTPLGSVLVLDVLLLSDLDWFCQQMVTIPWEGTRTGVFFLSVAGLSCCWASFYTSAALLHSANETGTSNLSKLPRWQSSALNDIKAWPKISCNDQFCLCLWQSEGTLLATGSYDGFARIWTKDGEKAFSATLSRKQSNPRNCSTVRDSCLFMLSLSIVQALLQTDFIFCSNAATMCCNCSIVKSAERNIY